MEPRPSLTLLTLAVVLLFGLPLGRVPRAQSFYCGEPTVCSNAGAFNTCIPVPTSLPAVDIRSAGDWYVDRPDSHCGAARCYAIFACECGAPLSSRLCTGAEKGSA